VKRKDVLIAISLSMFVLGVSIILGFESFIPIGTMEIRSLGKSYLKLAYNPWNTTHTSFSLNVVSAIIWDYRGLDTFYETCILLASIVAIVTLFRGAVEVKGVSSKGLSEITKTATKLIIPLIVLYGVITALHGHLTPGGGFQGGAIASVSISLCLVVYSLDYIWSKGLVIKKLMLLRVIGMLGIILICLMALITGLAVGAKAYIFQNMLKEDSPISYPGFVLDAPLAGALFFFNLFEIFVVVAGLSTALILLALRNVEFLKIFEVKETVE